MLGTSALKVPSHVLVKINSQKVWKTPRKRFDPQYPQVSVRRYGEVAFHKITGTWFAAMPDEIVSSACPPVEPLIAAFIEGLPDIITGEG